jgi:hypothetical protein
MGLAYLESPLAEPSHEFTAFLEELKQHYTHLHATQTYGWDEIDTLPSNYTRQLQELLRLIQDFLEQHTQVVMSLQAKTIVKISETWESDQKIRLSTEHEYNMVYKMIVQELVRASRIVTDYNDIILKADQCGLIINNKIVKKPNASLDPPDRTFITLFINEINGILPKILDGNIMVSRARLDEIKSTTGTELDAAFRIIKTSVALRIPVQMLRDYVRMMQSALGSPIVYSQNPVGNEPAQGFYRYAFEPEGAVPGYRSLMLRDSTCKFFHSVPDLTDSFQYFVPSK